VQAAVATLEECHDALERLAERLSGVDHESRRAHSFDRSLSCTLPDLDVTFTGELKDGTLSGISTDPAPKAQIRLTADSDDLIAMTDGHLSFGQAWVSGRVKVEAGVRDLLRLRSML
jgi:predicted lipid carrier protein YhbT